MGEFRVYRKIERGEFILVPGDCAQGGGDFNCIPFMSYEKLDFPIVYWNENVAATMTADIHPALEYLCDLTGILPIIGLERNNGGASEMERFRVLNRLNKYRLYVMKKRGKTDGEEESTMLGWSTDSSTRPYLLGDWKEAFDSHVVTIYDKRLLDHHKTFVKGSMGRPEAAKGTHDDGVFAPAIGWQMYQTERPVAYEQEEIYRPQYQPRDNVIGI